MGVTSAEMSGVKVAGDYKVLSKSGDDDVIPFASESKIVDENTSSSSSEVNNEMGDKRKPQIEESLLPMGIADMDLEAGDGRGFLHPGIASEVENSLRWGFIRKVYGIIGLQLLMTIVVAGFMSSPQVAFALASRPPLLYLALILPLITLIPLYHWRNKYPQNLLLLTLWTGTIGITVGVGCSVYQAIEVMEALGLTTLSVTALVAFTFYAARQGKDFSFLGPALFTSLWVLLGAAVLQIFFPLGSLYKFVCAVGGALAFSLFIVYDTDNLIKRYSLDEYVWASVEMYLDAINLFLNILRILRR